MSNVRSKLETAVAGQAFRGRRVRLVERHHGHLRFVLKLDDEVIGRFRNRELGFAAFCAACDETATGQMSIFSKEAAT